jgi:hypothetical protein
MVTLQDDRLAQMARRANVAQFASFAPGRAQLRHLVVGAGVARPDGDLRSVVAALVSRSAAAPLLNVRTFVAGESKGTPFFYGMASVDDVAELVRQLAALGYYTIVNETVDVDDGGVSGVLLGDIAEFAPGRTPRAVEEADAAALPAPLAVDLLRTVYGAVDLQPRASERIEFSVHPRRVGLHRTSTLLWDVEDVEPVRLQARPTWPNAFSRHIGDKAYGLLVAHLLGLPVPMTTVIGRRVAPFAFGRPTAAGPVDRWVRTCPVEPEPGRFTSRRGWLDPFALLAEEDPTSRRIASVLDQQAVAARYAGATGVTDGGAVLVEGVAGEGDGFMLGARAAEPVPPVVAEDVIALVRAAAPSLGPVRIEWAHDGERAWVLQLHTVRARVGAGYLNPGEAREWLRFHPEEGLERLRELADRAAGSGQGVLVVGEVGLTSHVGDILRRAGVPGRLLPAV